MTAFDGKWAKEIRDTPTPDRFMPFYTKGNTHRGPYTLEAAGWYFLDKRDNMHGPFASRLIARRAADREEAA